MEVGTEITQRLNHYIDQIEQGNQEYVGDVWNLLMWGLYGQRVLSQYGYGVYSWMFRQQNGNTQLVIKATEDGVPLVAFITASGTMGCIEQMFSLLESDRLRWQKDQYPTF